MDYILSNSVEVNLNQYHSSSCLTSNNNNSERNSEIMYYWFKIDYQMVNSVLSSINWCDLFSNNDIVSNISNL